METFWTDRYALGLSVGASAAQSLATVGVVLLLRTLRRARRLRRAAASFVENDTTV